MIKRFLWVGFLFFASAACAQTYKAIGADGLRGEEILTLAACPSDPSEIWLGTSGGVYRRKEGESTWRSGAPSTETMKVRQILFSVSSASPLVVSDRGLFELEAQSDALEKIFERSEPAEIDCYSVGRLKDGTLFLGTGAGLFFKNENQSQWSKASSPLDRESIVSVFCADAVVFAATATSVYKSEDTGKTWEKIFNVYFYGDVAQEALSEASELESAKADEPPVRHLAGGPQERGIIYVATDRGVFSSKNKGKSWDRLPVAGLDVPQIRYLYVDPLKGALWAVAKSGLYSFVKSAWDLVAPAHDGRAITGGRDGVIFATNREVYLCLQEKEVDGRQTTAAVNGLGQSTSLFENEPTIRDIQLMAIKYCDVANTKIDAWRRNARLKAFVPEVRLDVDKTIDTALGSTYERTLVGPQDWGISLAWELGDFLYSAEQTSIDNRSKLMVQLRNDVLSEVTRLYFERRKLQIELFSAEKLLPAEFATKKLRLEEATALIERLIGCSFEKVLKSRK